MATGKPKRIPSVEEQLWFGWPFYSCKTLVEFVQGCLDRKWFALLEWCMFHRPFQFSTLNWSRIVTTLLETNQYQALQWVMTHQKEINWDKEHEFYTCCGRGFLESAQVLWQHGIHLPDDTIYLNVHSKRSVFELECWAGHLNVVKWLWSLGFEHPESETLKHTYRSFLCKKNSVTEWLQTKISTDLNTREIYM